MRHLITACMLSFAFGMRVSLATEEPAPRDSSDGAMHDHPSLGTAQIADLPAEAPVLTNMPGICLDLGCGDGKLALELIRHTRYTVFALAKDDLSCDQTRHMLDKSNVYGTRGTVVRTSLNPLPIPNGYGNLIVTEDYPDDLNLKEVVRVLNPNGMAIIGGGKADPCKLKAGLDAAGIKDYKLFDHYAVFHGRMPDGLDEWTHFAHAPDNIQTSHETDIRPPFRTQWYQSFPTYDDKATDHGSICGGRMVFRTAVPKPDPDRYFAFDAFNGTPLWQKPVSRARNNYRYAHVDGVFYSPEGPMVVALDAATGEKMHEYNVFEGKGYVFWIAVTNHVLYGLTRINVPTNNPVFGAGDFFFALNTSTGSLIWKKQVTPPAVCWSVALDNQGGLFYTAADAVTGDKHAQGTICCLECETGAERWHTDAGPVKATYNDGNAAGCYDNKYFVWICEGEKGVVGTKSFDAKTGLLVRDYPRVRSYGESSTEAALDFVDGKIYCNTQPSGPYQCYDIATGAKLKTTIDNHHARDNVGHASATCLYAGGESECVQDLVNGNEWDNPFVRPGDFSSDYPAEGMLFHFPCVCHCPHMFGAPIALAPAGVDWQPPSADQDMPTRLVAGPALDQPLTKNNQEEWTHYRGGMGHTGESATPPRMPLKLNWERNLGCHLTPPSFGAGLVYVGLQNAAVVALDQTTGEIRWRFLCGARVRVTPAFNRGRVVFGSDDGWVYCLDAKTGQLAWRFRAAPEERYINAESQMNSQWPSTAGVLLENDSVYCAAGFLSFDGGYLYALDLKSGKPQWAKRIGGPDLLKGAPHGVMALTGDTLILPVFHAGPLNSAYNKTDGELIAWYKTPYPGYWYMGSEALADGDVFFYGGPRHSNDEWRGGHAAYVLFDVKTGWPCGKASSGTLAARNIAPVLGKTVLLGDGMACDRKTYCEAIKSEDGKAAKTNTQLWSVAFWPDKTQKTSALLLAGDVAIAAGTTEIAAFDSKKNGQELGRLTVPSPILRNSLAITAGKLFAVSENGSVYRLNGE